MHRFFVDDDLNGPLIQLPHEETIHAVQVLRITSGNEVVIVNGKGVVVVAQVEKISRKKCTLRTIRRLDETNKRSARIHIAIAPTKSIDRYEWFLEKATEIGVDRITPLITQNSERRKVRHDRSLKVLIAAMKQSKRSWLPELDELVSLKEFLAMDLPESKAFGWFSGEHRSIMDWYSLQDSLVIIGPEGDFTVEEAELMQESECQPVSIGGMRLRTETAGVAACTWLSLRQQQ